MSKKLVTDVRGELRSQIIKAIAIGILALLGSIGVLFFRIAIDNPQIFNNLAIVILGFISITLAVFIWRSKSDTRVAEEPCKSGNIFWLCSDTRQAMAMVSSGSMVQIIDALERVHHHATQIGLVLDGKKIDRLWTLRNEAIGAVNHDWLKNKRDSVWQELKSFSDDASQEIQHKQKGFIPDPPLQYKPT